MASSEGKSEDLVIKTAMKFGPTVKVRRSYEVEKEQSKSLSRPQSSQEYFKTEYSKEQNERTSRPHSSYELDKKSKESSTNDALDQRQQITKQIPKSVSLWSNGQLNAEVLKPLLLHPDIADLPVSVLAVAGEYRTGKSFLLSYILRLLRHLDIRTEACGDWLGDPDEPLEGFVHRHSLEPVTIGIDVWNEPFVVEKDGKRVAIILMDTQGIFDNEHSMEESYFIFAFTIMVSSVFVYNIHKEVNDHHHLEHLKMFIDYAKEWKTDNSKKDFQKLMFLIRDWSNVSDFAFGIEGGNHRIQEYLKIRKYHDGHIADIRKYIRDTWEDIQCYLMPHPGYDVTESKDYDGNLAGLRPAFKTHLKSLIEELMNPDKIIMKNISGIPITAAHLYLHITTSANNFKEKAASPENLREVNATFICNNAKITAYTTYQETMVDYIKSSESCWSDEELMNMSGRTLNYVVAQYDKAIATCVPEELKHIAKEKKEELTKECLVNYQKCYSLNYSRKTEELDLKEKAIAEAEKEAKAPWYQSLIGESIGGFLGGTVGMVLGTIVSPGIGTVGGAVAGVEAGKALGAVIGGYAAAGKNALKKVKGKIKD